MSRRPLRPATDRPATPEGRSWSQSVAGSDSKGFRTARSSWTTAHPKSRTAAHGLSSSSPEAINTRVDPFHPSGNSHQQQCEPISSKEDEPKTSEAVFFSGARHFGNSHQQQFADTFHPSRTSPRPLRPVMGRPTTTEGISWSKYSTSNYSTRVLDLGSSSPTYDNVDPFRPCSSSGIHANDWTAARGRICPYCHWSLLVLSTAQPNKCKIL